MSTRKRSKSTAPPTEEDVSATPRTRSRAAPKAKPTPVRRALVDDADFKKEDSESEKVNEKPQNKEQKIHYEFGGPVGAFGVILGTPFVMFMLYFLCNDQMCLRNPLSFDWAAFANSIKLENFFSKEATLIYLGWLAFSVLLERILPGELVEGTILPGTTNQRLKYTMSGHLQFWLSLLAMGHAYPLITSTDTGSDESWWTGVFQFQGFMPLRLELIYDNYLQMMAASLVFTAVFSLYL